MANKIQLFIQALIKSKAIQSAVTWLKRRSLPGFEGVPIWDTVVFIYKEARRDDLTTRANSMAFSFFLSLFPTIIFLFTLIPYFPASENYMAVLSDSIEEFFPDAAKDYILGIIGDILSIPRGGLLSIGFILALFFSSNGMFSMMRGFDKSYAESFKRRNVFQKYALAIWLVFILFLLLIFSVVLIIGGQQILNYIFEFLNWGEASAWSLGLLRFIAVIFLFYGLISAIYYFGPSLRKRMNWFSPGATLATFLSLLTSVGFSYFVNNFGRYNEIYGTIGALIVVLIWIQFNCFILLVGFELNASIAVNRDLKSSRPE